MGFEAIAQTAKYGENGRGDYDEYISKDGSVYKVGEKLKIGTPQGLNKTFTFILEGDGILVAPTSCPAARGGMEYEIKSFRAGNKAQGYKIWSKMKCNALALPLIVDFENALQSGELIGYGYTRDQALQELKKFKDMYDLELISKEDYDKKKEELQKYILQ